MPGQGHRWFWQALVARACPSPCGRRAFGKNSSSSASVMSHASTIIFMTSRCPSIFRAHAFELACAQNDIDHRLTKPKHPWTNGQVERMNRTIKEAVKRFYYETHAQLRSHLGDFVSAYNFAKRLEDPQRPHALRTHLQDLDKRARTIHVRSSPSNAGTKHLGYRSQQVAQSMP